jgi:hypothetical protein
MRDSVIRHLDRSNVIYLKSATTEDLLDTLLSLPEKDHVHLPIARRICFKSIYARHLPNDYYSDQSTIRPRTIILAPPPSFSQ